jgi:alpha-tubulin suppressor-like RCC1 family protein
VTWILPEDPIKRLHRLIREKMNDKPKIITAKTAYFWGRKDGIRKLKLSNMKIVDAALGGTFLNILTQTGDIITLNSIGHDYPLGDPQAIPRPSTKRFIKIAANVNCDHALALDEGGVLWAWGSNSSGQLGIAEDVEGDFSDQNTPVKVILPFSEGIRDIYAGGNGDAGYSYLITGTSRSKYVC